MNCWTTSCSPVSTITVHWPSASTGEDLPAAQISTRVDHTELLKSRMALYSNPSVTQNSWNSASASRLIRLSGAGTGRAGFCKAARISDAGLEDARSIHVLVAESQSGTIDLTTALICCASPWS